MEVFPISGQEKIFRFDNGVAINNAAFLRLRRQYSLERIANDLDVSLEELIDKLGITIATQESEHLRSL